MTDAESELRRRGIRYEVAEPGEAYDRDVYTCTIQGEPPISALADTRDEAIQRAFERMTASASSPVSPRLGVAVGLLIAAIVAAFVLYDYFAGGVPDDDPAPLFVPARKKQRVRLRYRERRPIVAPSIA